MGELLTIALIVFIVIPAPIFIVLHFITKWKQSREISGGDEKMLEDMWLMSQRMEERLETLETILDDELPECRENGWIFGVCAGLADYFNFRTGTVRIVALISLVVFFWATVLIYVGATLLFREKPLIYSGRQQEYEFWRRFSRDDCRHS